LIGLCAVSGIVTFFGVFNSPDFLGAIDRGFRVNESEVRAAVALMKSSWDGDGEAEALVFPMELPPTFGYYALLHDFELKASGWYHTTTEGLYDLLPQFDYLLVCENESSWQTAAARHQLKEILAALANESHEINEHFKLLKEFRVTDEWTVGLYKNLKNVERKV
jgi:hypothetical protein